jgi:hypothetical protein
MVRRPPELRERASFLLRSTVGDATLVVNNCNQKSLTQKLAVKYLSRTGRTEIVVSFDDFFHSLFRWTQEKFRR